MKHLLSERVKLVEKSLVAMTLGGLLVVACATPAIAGGSVTSNGFAGYVTSSPVPLGNPTSAEVTFVVPKLTCPTVPAPAVPLAITAGVSLVVSSVNIGGGIALQCSPTGVASYTAEGWYSGATFTLPTVISPGDKVIALAVNELVGGTLTAFSRVEDLTTGAAIPVGPFTGYGQIDVAAIGMSCGDRPNPMWQPLPGVLTNFACGSYPASCVAGYAWCGVPKFKKISFTNALVNGSPLGGFGPVRYQLASPPLQVTTSGLKPAGAGGTNFKDWWRHL